MSGKKLHNNKKICCLDVFAAHNSQVTCEGSYDNKHWLLDVYFIKIIWVNCLRQRNVFSANISLAFQRKSSLCKCFCYQQILEMLHEPYKTLFLSFSHPCTTGVTWRVSRWRGGKFISPWFQQIFWLKDMKRLWREGGKPNFVIFAVELYERTTPLCRCVYNKISLETSHVSMS